MLLNELEDPNSLSVGQFKCCPMYLRWQQYVQKKGEFSLVTFLYSILFMYVFYQKCDGGLYYCVFILMYWICKYRIR